MLLCAALWTHYGRLQSLLLMKLLTVEPDQGVLLLTV
jgi:hypothetical protein